MGHGSINDEPIGLTIVILGYALETAAFTLNRVLSKSVDKTPYEIWTGKSPSLSFLKIRVVKHLSNDSSLTRLHPNRISAYSWDTQRRP